MKDYVVQDEDLKRLILEDAPVEIQKDYDSPSRESEWAPREEMLRRKSGTLIWTDFLDGWLFKLPKQRVQYFFRAKTPTHYIGMMHSNREAKEIGASLAKPKAKRGKPPPL